METFKNLLLRMKKMENPKTKCITVEIDADLVDAMDRKAKRESKKKYALYNDAVRAYIGKSVKKEVKNVG